MGHILTVTITDDLSDYSARVTLFSAELATSMQPGLLVGTAVALLSQIADASPNLGGGPDVSGNGEEQRALEPSTPDP